MKWAVSETLVGSDTCGVFVPSAVLLDDDGREIGEITFFGEGSRERSAAFAQWMNVNAGPCAVYRSRKDYRIMASNAIDYTAGRHPSTEVEDDYRDSPVQDSKPPAILPPAGWQNQPIPQQQQQEPKAIKFREFL